MAIEIRVIELQDELDKETELNSLFNDIEETMLGNVSYISRESNIKGAKNDVETVGLLISFLITSQALKKLSNVLISWAQRHNTRKLELKIGNNSIKIEGINTEEQRRVIDMWIKQVSLNSKKKKK